MNDHVIKGANFFVGLSLLAALLSIIIFMYSLAYQQYNITHSKMSNINESNIHNAFTRINNIQDPIPIATVYSLCITYPDNINSIQGDSVLAVNTVSDLNKYLDSKAYVKATRTVDDLYDIELVNGSRCD